MAVEKEIRGVSGWLSLLFLITVLVAAAAILIQGIGVAATSALHPEREVHGWRMLISLVVIAADALCLAGLTVVNPNEAKVVTLFGVYRGTIKLAGLRWVNPLTTRRRLSLRVRNFESGHIKVNDHDGNPIEIAAVVVWRIVETF